MESCPLNLRWPMILAPAWQPNSMAATLWAQPASLARQPANESLAPADSAVNMSPDADDLYVPARPLVNRPVFPLRRRLMWRAAKHHTGVNHRGAARAAVFAAGLYRTFMWHAAVRRRQSETWLDGTHVSLFVLLLPLCEVSIRTANKKHIWQWQQPRADVSLPPNQLMVSITDTLPVH